MYDLFIDYIDSIYFPGYAEQMLEENPEKAFFELQQFLDAYN